MAQPDTSALPVDALSLDERVHYRDELRAARYAALADSEGFGEICYAIEALGIRLHGRQVAMSGYEGVIKKLALESPLFSSLINSFPSYFTKFGALYETLRTARNDAMHSGTYARHATEAAIELCIGLEDALMFGTRRHVKDLMVKSPTSVDPRQPLARARQLMLMHSFSFLPVRINNEWKLVSELGLALYLHVNATDRNIRLAQSIEKAVDGGLKLVDIQKNDLLVPNTSLQDVFTNIALKIQPSTNSPPTETARPNEPVPSVPMLWLVLDKIDGDDLVGVLSPFELM
jgi:CBS domain-containing protein